MGARISRRLLFLFTTTALSVAGCDQAQNAGQPSMPAPKVTVRQPVKRPIVNYREFTGRIEATDRVEVRARVKGFLEKILFKEGAEVKEGDLLYVIDPREYAAAVADAKAVVAKQEAQAQLAKEEAERGKQLLARKAMSTEEYQQRVATSNAAQATLAEAKAKLETAQLQLDFTQIHARIAGRVGRTLVTQGNLVGFNEPTLLTTIVAVDPVYVYFEVPEREFLDYQQKIREEGAPSAEQAKVPVHVGLADEKGFPHEGIIDFRNNQVDPGTGTIQIRGQLANPDRLLTPGLFARVRVPIGKAHDQLLVPEVALSSDQRGEFVLLVQDDNTVKAQPVKTGVTTDDGMVVLESGIQATDWVIVDGLQRARPGGKVQPVKAE
jgi:RND family efflux transporter MFP subunit